MASPFTVDDLMSWLSSRFQVWLPSLAQIQPWPFLVRLWGYVVPGGPPAGDPPWAIDVDGEIEVLGMFQLEKLQVIVAPRNGSGDARSPLH